MINLKSIRVRNFRAVKEATFRPLEEGITGIFGPNGAGKTTFLAATMFALYGVKPPGASQNSLRRTGSKGESSVSVVFTHMEQTVEIIREIKSPNNRIVVNIYVDGQPQTVTSVSAADQWVKTRLGIDAVGFMTAFVVRQKELDQLVNAKPAERKAIIEKLAGVDTINSALKYAREEENLGKKTLATIGGNPEDVAKASEALELTLNRITKLSETKSSLDSLMLSEETKAKDLKDKAAAIKDDELKIQELTTKIELYSNTLEDLKKDLAALPELYEDELTIDELRALHKELTSNVDALNQRFSEAKTQYTTWQKQSSELSENIKLLESKMELQPVELNLEHDYESELAKKQEELEELLHESSGLKANLESLNISIESLKHAEECPTCRQEIKDSSLVVSSLTDLSKNISYQIQKLEKSLLIKREEISRGKEMSTLKLEFKQVSEELSDCKLKMEELNSNKIDEEFISSIKTEIDSAITERESVLERGQKLKDSLASKSAYDSVISKQKQASEALAISEAELDKITKKIGGAAALKGIAELNKIENSLIQTRKELTEINNQMIALESRAGQEKQSYKTAKELWERKQELLKKQEKSALTTDVIDKFRKEIIASLAPELSEYATGLISEMTNGDFIEVRLDDEFNPSVVDSAGNERPVSWLSGGEESAVALALRLAIAFLITGGRPELLWLDEVLTAQDADRRSTMLSMIRRLPISQIIMINHTQEAGDVVDKSVEIVPNLQEGSTILESLVGYDDEN